MAGAIEAVAATNDPVTIVVGAGASAEAGFLPWRDLLMVLLRDAAAKVEVVDEGDGASAVTEFCEAILQAEGLLGAAEVVKACLGPGFEEQVVKRLYQVFEPTGTGKTAAGTDRTAAPLPGPTANAVATLATCWDGDIEIVTFNYDLLLEHALIEAGVAEDAVVTAADGDARPDAQFVVRHLHGARSLDPGDSRNVGELVLAEHDYMTLRDDSWQEVFFSKRLKNSLCLFVGMSMGDPNLLRFLHRQTEARGHIAILPRQGESTAGRRLSPEVRYARERAADQRWAEAGVWPLRCDFFVQSSQLLLEITHRRVLGDAYQHYRERMQRWDLAMEASVLQTEDEELFRETQDRLQSALQDLLRDTRALIEEYLGPLPEHEHLGLHLWVRRFTNRELVLWGSSDRAWRDPQTIHPVPIALPTQYISVLGFCNGTPIARRTPTHLSRWSHVCAIPLFMMGDADTGRLPVGVLTFASTRGEGESCLERLRRHHPDKFDVVRDFVSAAVEILTPGDGETD